MPPAKGGGMEINMKQLKILILVCLCCLNLGCSKADTMNNLATGESPSEEASAENGTENQETGKENILSDDSIKEKLIVTGKYSGWICGLVSDQEDDNSSDVLLINPKTKEVERLTVLQGVYQTQACAVSPDGNRIAYTTWIDEEDTRKGVCIAVKDMNNNSVNQYFNDNGYNPLITYISWMPDNKTLLFNISIEDQQYYTDVVCLFDVEEEKLQVIDKGRVWQGQSTLDYKRNIIFSELNQKELNDLIDKYGGNVHIPVEENGGYNYVEFGMPILSPDQTKIMYATNFCRNMAVGKADEPPAMLCLASGIFIADSLGAEEPQLIYGNHVEHSRIGKIIWGRNSNEIIFDRYYNEQSRGVCDIVLYNIETGEEKILIESSAQMETQKPRFRVDENRIGIYSDGGGGERLYYYDLSTDQFEEETITYNGNIVKLWRFCEIY